MTKTQATALLLVLTNKAAAEGCYTNVVANTEGTDIYEISPRPTTAKGKRPGKYTRLINHLEDDRIELIGFDGWMVRFEISINWATPQAIVIATIEAAIQETK